MLLGLVGCGVGQRGDATLLHASYDATRGFFAAFNEAFCRHWKTETGQHVIVYQSHAGSGKQARALLDGLPADVVSLALGFDVDALARRGNLMAADWRRRLPNGSSPFFSTVVFLVRPGNPKGIRDWDDLGNSTVEVISANPKTSGGARWAYLAAYAFAWKQSGGDRDRANEFVGLLFRRVPVLDSGARSSATTFLRHGVGDVLLCWESEAHMALREFGADVAQIVVPSISILAEPPVAWVDSVVERRGTQPLAQAYLQYLYSPAGQKLAAEHYLRPRMTSIRRQYRDRFPELELIGVDSMFDDWDQAHEIHFSEGAIFDQIHHQPR